MLSACEATRFTSVFAPDSVLVEVGDTREMTGKSDKHCEIIHRGRVGDTREMTGKRKNQVICGLPTQFPHGGVEAV